MRIPNILTIIRAIIIPVVAVMIYSSSPNIILASVAVFLLAVLTDWADGYIARNYNMKSVFGTFFDPLVDKMLILTMFFAFSNLGLIPLWMSLLVLFRELLVTGVRQVCSTEKKVVGANWMGKSKFLLQTVSVVYLQLVLYFKIIGADIIIFRQIVAFYFVLFVVIVSLAFAINFVYWHRKKILSDL